MTDVKKGSARKKGELSQKCPPSLSLCLFEILPLFFQHLEHNEEEIRQWTTNGGWEQIYIKCNYWGEGSGVRPGTPM